MWHHQRHATPWINRQAPTDTSHHLKAGERGMGALWRRGYVMVPGGNVLGQNKDGC